NILRKETFKVEVVTEGESQRTHNWLHITKIENKKKMVFWRLFHKTLPLGYRLKHIGQCISGGCYWCPGEQQTREHFAARCV
ncbi:8173_t:CDS:1, partial [Gigaspora rosea]